jgi:hypothetical protein
MSTHAIRSYAEPIPVLVPFCLIVRTDTQLRMSGGPQLVKRSLRIVALPLVAASRTPESSSSGHLTYYHFATPPPEQDEKRDLAKWATQRAAELWAGFGKAPEGHWKVRAAFCPRRGTFAGLA